MEPVEQPQPDGGAAGQPPDVAEALHQVVDDAGPREAAGQWAIEQLTAGQTVEAVVEELLAGGWSTDDAEEIDPSSNLDLETIASAASEMEAMGMKNLLESNGISTVLVGDSVLPNFAFEVRVARDQVDRARVLIADAEQIGSEAADEAELESESGA